MNVNCDFSGRVALVTGAAGNLGAAVAEAFHAAGARVALLDRTLALLQARHPAPDARRLLLAADLLDEAAVARAVDATMAAFGGVDIACNVAGGFAMGPPAHETPAETWRAMLDLNLMTAVNVCKAVVPRMIAAGRGSVVNVAAASAVRGQAGMAPYVVAKNAVVRLTESMADELREHGIAVTCVMPTIIDTPQNRAAMPGAGTSRWVPPGAIADAILLLASPAATPMTGVAVRVDAPPPNAGAAGG
jgi:NAD(P)-dependent dehydrogenase (short-subunit alcohol dehydrogenase family)